MDDSCRSNHVLGPCILVPFHWGHCYFCFDYSCCSSVLTSHFRRKICKSGLLNSLFVPTFSSSKLKLRTRLKETFERDSGERFSSQHRIKAYVPQVPDPSFRFPLIACDLSGIDPKNIGWIDPLRSQSYYSLDQDVQFLMKQEHNVSTEPKLSIVKHWPGAVQDESETAANAQANDLVRRYGGLRQGPSPSVEEDHEKV